MVIVVPSLPPLASSVERCPAVGAALLQLAKPPMMSMSLAGRFIETPFGIAMVPDLSLIVWLVSGLLARLLMADCRLVVLQPEGPTEMVAARAAEAVRRASRAPRTGQIGLNMEVLRAGLMSMHTKNRCGPCQAHVSLASTYALSSTPPGDGGPPRAQGTTVSGSASQRSPTNSHATARPRLPAGASSERSPLKGKARREAGPCGSARLGEVFRTRRRRARGVRSGSCRPG